MQITNAMCSQSESCGCCPFHIGRLGSTCSMWFTHVVYYFDLGCDWQVGMGGAILLSIILCCL